MADEVKAGEYICLVDVRDIKTQQAYKPGDKIRLTAEKAAILLAKGAVKAK